MKPLVSIIIVNFNQAGLTLDCVRSIREHTEPGSYDIIVVDNGSAPEEASRLAQAADAFEFLSLSRNLFFGEANNLAAERARGECLVFMNNDITVTPNWLDALLAVLRTEYRAGAVGAKFMYPNGNLLEAGAVIRPDGWSMQIGRSGVAFPPGFINQTRIADYCSAACLLMRRSDFLRLGGFDPIFEPAYFEDVDLAIRLRSIGLFTYYCADATVVHHESFTSGRIWTEAQRRSYVEENHRRLLSRWGAYLLARLDADIDPAPLPAIEWEAEPPAGEKPAALLYSRLPPDPGDPEPRLLKIACALERRFEVIFCSDERFSRCRIYSIGRAHGLAMKSFKVRKLSDIASEKIEISIGVGTELPRPAARHFTLERDAEALRALIAEGAERAG